MKELGQRLIEEDEAAADLDYALKQLTGKATTSRSVAQKKILGAGNAGRIVLRKVLRDNDAQLAPIAARLLAEAGDEAALPLLFERVARNPTGPDAKSLLPVLGGMANQFTPVQLGQVYGWLKTDKAARFELKEAVGFLGTVLQARCEGDREKLNALLNDPTAHDFLKAYAQAAWAAKDPAVSAWAARDGAVFEPMLPGLRGAYYLGVNFEKLALDRLDEKIEVPDRQFPYPDNTQDNISVRWTGFVVVKSPGKYTFYSASDDGQRVWVDDKLIIDDWNGHGVTEKQGEIELTEGLHAYKVEFFQGGGGAAITEWWSGPGLDRQVLTKEVLRTNPWAQAPAATPPAP